MNLWSNPHINDTVPQRGIRKGGFRKNKLHLWVTRQVAEQTDSWLIVWLDAPFWIPLWEVMSKQWPGGQKGGVTITKGLRNRFTILSFVCISNHIIYNFRNLQYILEFTESILQSWQLIFYIWTDSKLQGCHNCLLEGVWHFWQPQCSNNAVGFDTHTLLLYIYIYIHILAPES